MLIFSFFLDVEAQINCFGISCSQANYTINGSLNKISNSGIPLNLSNSIVCVNANVFDLDRIETFTDVVFLFSSSSVLAIGNDVKFVRCCFIPIGSLWGGVTSSQNPTGEVKANFNNCEIQGASKGISNTSLSNFSFSVNLNNNSAIINCLTGIELHNAKPLLISGSLISKQSSTISGDGIKLFGTILNLSGSSISGYATGIRLDRFSNLSSTALIMHSSIIGSNAGIISINNSKVSVFFSDFINCKTGINSTKSYLRSIISDFSYNIGGIVFTNGGFPGPGFKIDGNTIEGFTIGISILNSFISNNSSITNNVLIENPEFGTENTGININDVESFGNIPLIIANNPEINSSKSGIKILLGHSIKMENNNIIMSANTPSFPISAAAIQMRGCQNNFLLSNTVTGHSSAGGQGIRLDFSNKNAFCCNKLHDLENGMTAWGTSEATPLAKTFFNGSHKDIGLDIRSDGIIGVQDWKDNRWEQIGVNGYRNVSPDRLNSKFFVKSNNSPIHPINVSPFIDIVEVRPGSDETCLPNDNCGIIWTPKRLFTGLTSLDEFVMQDDFTQPDGDYSADWTRNLLFDLYFSDNTAVSQNASLMAYINDPINSIYKTTAELRHNFKNTFLNYYYSSSQNNYNNFNDYFVNLAEQLENGNEVIFDNIQPYMDSLNTLSNITRINYENQVLTDLMTLQNEFSNIPNGKVWAENERELYPIIIDYYISGIVSATQQAILMNIAETCPKIGGQAVYQAQSLLQILGISYIEVNECFMIIPFKVNKIKFKGTESSNFLNKIPSTSDFEMKVYDLYGRLLYEGINSIGSLSGLRLNSQIVFIHDIQSNKIFKHLLFD